MIARLMKAAAIVGVAVLALSGCSGALGSGPEEVRNFDIHYTFDRDGTVHVVETIDYNFGGAEERHGIERLFAVRFATDQPGQDRLYRYSNIEVSSPSGASALFSTSRGNMLKIRVGNKYVEVGGEHTYVIRYDIEGTLNRVAATDGSIVDEFYWNATGHYWDHPILNTTVTVEGPAPASLVKCYEGFLGSVESCASATKEAGAATFTANTLSSREGLTISVAWPEGTFTSTDPILVPSLPPGAEPTISGTNSGPNPFWHPLHWGTGLAGLVGIPLAFQMFVVARRRDRRFVGVTPGQIPADPATADIEKAPKDETIVVQYQPPPGLPVGAARTVLTKKRKPSDITVTLVDLAVRGHLRIEEIEGGNPFKAKDYRLVSTPERAAEKKARSRPGGPDAAELLPHETLLLGRLFSGYRTSVTLTALKNTFAADMRAIIKSLDTWIQHKGYFIDKVNASHPLVSWGMVVGGGGFILAMITGGIGSLTAGGILAGSLVTSAFSSKAIRRSALGHATYVQLAGFKEYISTAEADRIRFDEDEDVFSRYMPWAMVFGEAERWSRVFAELVAQGKAQPTPDWYVGTAGFHAGRMASTVAAVSSIGTAVSSFTSMATTSFSSTPGSSGGSGGGGSSGGGGGGGGGGSW